jgi:hypothetical protein
MWGTDITRVAGLHSYAEAVGAMLSAEELSPSELALVMGGALRRVLRWPKSA